MTIKRSITHEIRGPIKLEDLRVLVNSTSDAPGDTSLVVRQAENFNHPTDRGNPDILRITYEVTA